MWKASVVVLAALVAVAVGFGSMVGAPVSADINDEGVQNALNFAVGEHNKRTNDAFLRGVDEVLQVKRQMVAGMKYVITARMGKTPCRKNSATEVCAVHDDPEKAQQYQCTFTVWEKVWLNEIQLLREECSERGGEGLAQGQQTGAQGI
ncbi:cystatin C (amyloid angiopathy and cerebral hemorrhage) [Nelusetta ayraudi]|uniref:cystatin C (amyloid angiopathy and cerebral hemorrhage) n=1 Tax=Nelusetta ayraudi TaxID=303726 RepID=UPI003F6E8D11